MNIEKNKIKTKSESKNRSLDFIYHIEKSVLFGLLTVAIFLLTGAVSGDSLIGVFTIAATIFYFRAASTRKLMSHSSIRFDCSLSYFFEIATTVGFDLIKWSNDIYIFKTRHLLLKNHQIVVRDCQGCCEVSGKLTALELLKSNLVEDFDNTTNKDTN